MQYELPNGYLSASSLNTLLTCPRMFEFKYVQRIPTPPTASMLTGTALHKCFETYYRGVITNPDNRLTLNQMADLASATLEDTLTSEEHYLKPEEIEEATVTVRELAAAYAENVAPTITPLAVEEEHVGIARCGIPLLSYIDLRHQLPDGSQGIADYKVTTKRWTIDKLTNSLQFGLYALVTGLQNVEVHNLVKTAPAKRSTTKPTDGVTDVAPNIRILRHAFDGSNDHLENIIESSAALITAGIFPPCAMDAWNCNPDWCGYWNICRGKVEAKMFDLAA